MEHKAQPTSHRHDLQGQRSRSQGYMVCLTCAAHNSRMNSRRNIKIGRKFQHDTCNKVKKVKAQGHRSIYSHTQNTSYLPNGTAYELQTSYAGRGQSPASLATTMTSKIKGQGHKVTWCALCLTRPAHNSRTNSRRIIKIGSKVAHDMSNIAAMLLHPGGGIP